VNRAIIRKERQALIGNRLESSRVSSMEGKSGLLSRLPLFGRAV